MMTVTLGWPSRVLSPNARTHWATLSRAKKAARVEGYITTWMSKTSGTPYTSLNGAESISIQVTFIPPNARRRDLDNLIASIKGHLDGISDAIGIDDSRWIWAAPVIATPEKPGRVVVTLTPVEVVA
jgi:crossover junction endodeoxyribonuclease RusA